MENRCGQFSVVIEIHGAFGKVLSREGAEYRIKSTREDVPEEVMLN